MDLFRPHDLLGDKPRRPYSLASAEILRSLGVTVHHGAELSPKRESAEIRCYDYVHSAPLADVPSLLWTGYHEDEGAELLSETTVATFRLAMERQRAQIAAAEFRIRPTESQKQALEKMPADMKLPDAMTARWRRLARDTGWPRDMILWELPLHEALALLHASHIADGAITVAPDSGEDTPEDLRPEWMGEMNAECTNPEGCE